LANQSGGPSIISNLREATLEAYLEEYKKLNETWRSIEAKAQGSIAVSGIFIAAALAFITTANLVLRCHEKILLFIGLSCLIISVILAIITSRTISIIAAPLGSFRAKHTIDLGKVQNEAEQQEYLPILFAEHVAEWKKVIAAVNAVNDRRAATLWLAQLFLILAILAVALLAILKLIV
jgi:glucan phosphoethanolaminetransferase (alkaline phosphatase superfamily)